MFFINTTRLGKLPPSSTHCTTNILNAWVYIFESLTGFVEGLAIQLIFLLPYSTHTLSCRIYCEDLETVGECIPPRLG